MQHQVLVDLSVSVSCFDVTYSRQLTDLTLIALSVKLYTFILVSATGVCHCRRKSENNNGSYIPVLSAILMLVN